MLFSPIIKLPTGEILLPPLTAKLEPLPKIAAQHVIKKPHPKPKPQAQPTPVEPVHAAAPKPEEPSPTEKPEIKPEPPKPSELAPEIKPAHPLPKHAQLTFNVYLGTGLKIGEARHLLEIDDAQNYTLKVGINTTGIASLFKTFELSQQSSGTLTGQGLRPNEYSETRNTSKGREALVAKFNWAEKTLSFSNENSTPLPEQAQDILSCFYQLSQLAFVDNVLALDISNGKKLERYALEIGEEETLISSMGKLRALHLRKIHAPGEEGLDIWLGLEYRLLPIKIRQIDRDGKVAGEMVISDIRVSDE